MPNDRLNDLLQRMYLAAAIAAADAQATFVRPEEIEQRAIAAMRAVLVADVDNDDA